MGAACAAEDSLPAAKPTFHYLPIAGRGEAIKLTAAIGGLDMEIHTTDGKDLDMGDFGSPGGLPVFEHGDLKISQAPAILSYILSIAPKYKGLSSAQKARDTQVHMIVMDVMDSGVGPFFGKDPEMKKKIGDSIDKWYPILEGIAPTSGFVLGLSFPTCADLSIVTLKEGQTPYIGLCKVAGKDPWATCPKLRALAERTAAVPAVKAFLADSPTLKANPFGFPA